METISAVASQSWFGTNKPNVPTLEKSASMLSDGPEASGNTKDEIMSKELATPQSPTGVWDYFFPSNEVNGTEESSVVSNTTGYQSIASQPNQTQIPERLIDFFCVVGHDITTIRDFTETPSDLSLQPKLIECYPERRGEQNFPQELPMFCMPNNCQLSTKNEKPTLSTFVLTSSEGHRQYGTALIYYELIPLEDLCEGFWRGDCILPAWLENPQPYYLPRCLVVLSHHAYFDVQRTFLEQFYRISKSGRSPLPLERYIANFVHDVPLPRPGAASISWKCFTNDAKVDYRRPATNEMPLVNFSFEPLFRALSISNVLTIWGILLQEGRVVLRSENPALLTPVAEGLTSLLFPLTWQGVYVPVLPSSMLDVLEAPVPFLVGFVGTNSPQPPGVVICDLDQDIVHLGSDDYNNPRTLPQLPKTLIAALKVELEDVADSLYLVPPCGMKGRVTTAVHGLLENTMRESYGHMVQVREASLTNTHRQDILIQANGLQRKKRLGDEDFVLYEDEKTKYQSVEEGSRFKCSKENGGFINALRRQGRALQARTDKALSFTPTGTARYDKGMEKKKDDIARNLYKVDDDFAHSIRISFLRFFSKLLRRYKAFTNKGIFKHAAFADSMVDMTHGNRLYVESIVQTQMFERFLVESSTRRRLFDELMVLQTSDKSSSEQKDTPFLDDQLAVMKIVSPAAPCAAGVRKDIVYEYHGFPDLNLSEMVAHKTLDPVSALCYLGNDIMCDTSYW